jgi:SAM-dependent methyltransferase
MSLDLYARIEPYIGFYEHYERLYGFYLKILKEYNVKKILDVGCGNGRMLQRLSEYNYDARGIDLSPKMVDIANSKGVKASCQNISEVSEKFDAVISVADVLNYMDKKSLERFLGYIKSSLKKGGVFICDINSKHGFCDVADGTMIKEDMDIFLAIDAVFDGEVLDTGITFFEKEEDLYKKHSGTILQYFHKEDDIKKMTPMKLKSKDEISLFSDQPDKIIFTFVNE